MRGRHQDDDRIAGFIAVPSTDSIDHDWKA
jgi:hypothetical protein